jgi:hypothetical protein
MHCQKRLNKDVNHVLYISYTKSSIMYTYTESKVRATLTQREDFPWNNALHRAVSCDLEFAKNTR